MADARSPSIFRFVRSAPQVAALREVCALWRAGPEAFWAFDDVLEAMSRPPASCAAFFVADSEDGAWRGILFADVGPFSADLLYVYVRPEHRREGIGRRLVEHLIAELAKRPQIEALFLEVRASNKGAQALYEAIGMRPIGRRRSYYQNGEDALVFRYELGKAS
jgi:ribosomal-protein-alanine N-acetyltransferase